MSQIFEELLNSSPFAVIELFELELFEKIHGSSEEYYFYNGVNKKDTPGSIIFDGKSYTGIAIEADGYIKLRNKDGQLKSLRTLEWEIMEQALNAHNGNVVAASQALGIGKSTMYRRIDEEKAESSAEVDTGA